MSCRRDFPWTSAQLPCRASTLILEPWISLPWALPCPSEGHPPSWPPPNTPLLHPPLIKPGMRPELYLANWSGTVEICGPPRPVNWPRLPQWPMRIWNILYSLYMHIYIHESGYVFTVFLNVSITVLGYNLYITGGNTVCFWNNVIHPHPQSFPSNSAESVK